MKIEFIKDKREHGTPWRAHFDNMLVGSNWGDPGVARDWKVEVPVYKRPLGDFDENFANFLVLAWEMLNSRDIPKH